jgi:hypothetical protein
MASGGRTLASSSQGRGFESSLLLWQEESLAYMFNQQTKWFSYSSHWFTVLSYSNLALLALLSSDALTAHPYYKKNSKVHSATYVTVIPKIML